MSADTVRCLATAEIVAARTITNYHFPFVLDAMVFHYEDRVPVTTHDTHYFGRILEYLGRTPLTICLGFIKKHVADLRHAVVGVTSHKVGDVARCIRDILSAMDILSTEPKTERLVEMLRNFYDEYTAMATELRLGIVHLPVNVQQRGVLLSIGEPPMPKPEEPPQGQTLQWYKTHNWAKFLVCRYIVPLDGPREGKTVLFLGPNGHNSIIFEKDKRTYVNNSTRINWYNYLQID